MGDASCKFLDGMQDQEKSGFKDLERLPVPEQKKVETMLHMSALRGGFLKEMPEDKLKRVKPSEVIIYKHAQKYMSVQVHTSTY